jgi:hypothetical protein
MFHSKASVFVKLYFINCTVYYVLLVQAFVIVACRPAWSKTDIKVMLYKFLNIRVLLLDAYYVALKESKYFIYIINPF